jgi:hypothetical protein
MISAERAVPPCLRYNARVALTMRHPARQSGSGPPTNPSSSLAYDGYSSPSVTEPSLIALIGARPSQDNNIVSDRYRKHDIMRPLN